MAINRSNSISSISNASVYISKNVYFNGNNPSSATIFDTANPAVTNDSALKNNSTFNYIGTDGSVWTYSSTGYKSADWESGDVLQIKVFNGTTEITGDENLFTQRTINIPNFTPKSDNSTLLLHFDADLNFGGTYGADEYQVIIQSPTGTPLFEKRFRYINNPRGGMRGSPAVPISAKYVNSSKTAKSFSVFINRINGDDSLIMYSYRLFTITEIQN